MDLPGHWRELCSLRLFLCFVCLCLADHRRFSLATAIVEDDYASLLEHQGLNENSLEESKNQQLESLSHLLPLSSEQIDELKRSSSFFPLRGKKVPDTNAHYPTLSEEEESKRSQFYPLRGKKVPDDLKRASYFMPMRGRKEDENWLQNEEEVEKRMSFMPMRGKKRLQDSMAKFALKRPMSFFATRGKRFDGSAVDSKLR